MVSGATLGARVRGAGVRVVARWRAAAEPAAPVAPLMRRLYSPLLALSVVALIAFDAHALLDPPHDDDLVWLMAPAGDGVSDWVDLVNPEQFGYYRPLAKTVFRAIHVAFGADSVVALRIACALLWAAVPLALAFLMRALGASRLASALAAYIFVVQPTVNWTVAWMTTGWSGLGSAGVLAATAVMVRAPGRGGAVALATALYALSLASSETAVIYPALVVAVLPFVRARDGRIPRAMLVALGLAAALTALYGAGKALDPDLTVREVPTVFDVAPAHMLEIHSPGPTTPFAFVAVALLLTGQRAMAVTLALLCILGLYPGVLKGADRMAYHVPIAIAAGAGLSALMVARIVHLARRPPVYALALVWAFGCPTQELGRNIGSWEDRALYEPAHTQRNLQAFLRINRCFGGDELRFLPRWSADTRALRSDYALLCRGEIDTGDPVPQEAIGDVTCDPATWWADPWGYLSPCHVAPPGTTAGTIAALCPGPIPSTPSYRAAASDAEAHVRSESRELLRVCGHDSTRVASPADALAPERVGDAQTWRQRYDSLQLFACPSACDAVHVVAEALGGDGRAVQLLALSGTDTVWSHELLGGESVETQIACDGGFVAVAQEAIRPGTLEVGWELQTECTPASPGTS